MPRQWYRIFQAILLLALFFFLGSKVISNQLSWYINPRFIILTQVGIVFLGILVYRLILEIRGSYEPHDAHEHHEHDEHDHDHAPAPFNLLIMLLPLLIGILIPARPLGSTAISTKGLTSTAPIVSSQAESRQLVVAADQRDILGWVILFTFEDNLEPFMGEQASVTGFVYRDKRLPEGQFLVSRIVIACCAADGYAAVMLVDWPESASLKEDTWVHVTGPVDKAYLGDDPQAIPLVKAESVEIVPAPKQPYLFP